MFRACVRSRSSAPRTEIDSGTSTTDCETFCAVTTTSSRFVTSGSILRPGGLRHQQRRYRASRPENSRTGSHVSFSPWFTAVFSRSARHPLSPNYSDTDTNVLIRELSIDIGQRAGSRAYALRAPIEQPKCDSREHTNRGQQHEEGRMAHARPESPNQAGGQVSGEGGQKPGGHGCRAQSLRGEPGKQPDTGGENEQLAKGQYHPEQREPLPVNGAVARVPGECGEE